MLFRQNSSSLKEVELDSPWTSASTTPLPTRFSDHPTALSTQETSIEISVITPSTPSAPVTNPRMQYLRSPSLPAYENVVSEQSVNNIETPPPDYDETVNKFNHF